MTATNKRPLQDDYLERVYAGVLGKLVGVYVGRPFEGWTQQRIMAELGHIYYYVHEQLDQPLLVTDDDISGTFQFLRALVEHGVSADISAEDIGRTWLNTVVENRTIFWWGGRGQSTEHTAYLNLKSGIPAPLSGSSQTNGKSVSEQIGAQIFIDGWALVSPGNPTQAAKLAKAAGTVSHDGESVFAAQLWAAMEAEAFVSDDIDHILDTGLSVIPPDSLITQVINAVRQWVKEDQDWMKTRNRIEATYGYDKFHGNCHVVPNHAIMIMAVLYSSKDFDEAMHLINTCGWDTDCNSGNVGCLVAIIMGLAAFQGKQDWRGPLADRALLSTAEVGYAINNASRLAIDVANLGRQLAGYAPLPPPKDGAQFHFTLPGGVQGFETFDCNVRLLADTIVKQGVDQSGVPGLDIYLKDVKGDEGVEVSTAVFGSLDEIRMKLYEFTATPLLYPGQTVIAKVGLKDSSSGPVKVGLRLRVFGDDDVVKLVDGPCVALTSSTYQDITWTIPDTTNSRPILRVGLYILPSQEKSSDAVVRLDSLRWSGAPRLSVRRPSTQPGESWYRSWVNGVSKLHCHMSHTFIPTQAFGEGIIIYGGRDWTDYRLHVPKFKINSGAPVGIAVRVQGLNRYYSLVLSKGRRISLVKARDEDRITLASSTYAWELDVEYDLLLEVQGNVLRGQINGFEISASDDQYTEGGVGLVVTQGAVCVESVDISPLEM
ncbi:adp-ribosylation crystallin j1 [Fusarium albosuccineum]|uniref:Adp-ribosylation crystallin j1 n=1 Tax=Fusarium albosuccineum TaxID=1237068 RepID=A0A8H4KZB5_9HYPO|nr:adp-ribosylation crystallin j1 [Fusarium albosuccineum]